MTGVSERPPLPRREDYVVWRQATTRWADDDVYGHMNNAVYFELIDTAVNAHLAEATGVPLVLAESSKSPENPKSSKRDQDGSGVVGPGDVTDWFAEAMASNTLRHSSVSAFTVSS